MKIRYLGILLILIAAASFFAGYWINRNDSHKPAEARRVLYYVDPMNPAFKSDKPGVAPCGMPLEPVYADQNAAGAGDVDLGASMPPGAFRISAERQQLIGVKTMTVEKMPWNHTLRILGRVTPDETRIFRVIAATSGLITETTPVTTGSMVRKGDMLAKFSPTSTEFFRALQSYLTVVNAGNVSAPSDRHPQQQYIQVDKAPQAIGSPNIQKKEQMVKEFEEMRNLRMKGRVPSSSSSSPSSSPSNPPSSSPSTSSNPTANAYRQSLFSYGIGEPQIKEIERTRIIPTSIDIRSPAAGFVILRNVSPGFSFDRGVELFRIADLSRVWILADVFENESSFFKPGMQVKMELPYQKKILYARMSNVLPQFDPSTRTLKIRLEAENPGYAMRPDMLVNVDIPTSGPPAIIVPVEAVLDSGLNKTVFVDQGSGFFEPRQVETGRSLGERIEITRGLLPGEKIVVSGNFLIDSEARMQKVAAGITGKIARDPVCGMNVDEDRTRAAGNYLDYKGQTYFFCDAGEREDFRKDPERYLNTPLAQKRMATAKSADIASKKHASHDSTTTHKSTHSNKAMMHHDDAAMPMPSQVKQEPMSGTQGMAPSPTATPIEMQKAGTASSRPAMPDSGGAKWHPGTAVPGAKGSGVFNPSAPSTDSKFPPDMFKPVPGAVPGAPSPGPTVQPMPRPADQLQRDTSSSEKSHD